MAWVVMPNNFLPDPYKCFSGSTSKSNNNIQYPYHVVTVSVKVTKFETVNSV